MPGDPDDTHSRYIEGAVNGIVVGCLYLPNGNPQLGPKFDYKLAWFERLLQHAKCLLASDQPVVLAGIGLRLNGGRMQIIESFKVNLWKQPSNYHGRSLLAC